MVDALLPSSPPQRRRPPPALLPLLLLSSLILLMQSPAVVVSLSTRAEDAAAPSSLSDQYPTVLGSINNSTATSEKCSNSTKDIVDMPAVSLSLALGVSQELNPNPFIHPNPVLSLSLSLSVSEELRGNPFELMNDLTPPTPQPEPDPQIQEDQPKQQQQQQEQEQEQEQEQRQRQRAETPQQQLQPIKQRVSRQRPVKGVEEGPAVPGRVKCTYTVSIKTSCSSPRATRDAISLAFGDAYHNEVYAARLDDPASGSFDRCSLDTFRVDGPCGTRTCYLYLRRSGRDGWTPEYAKVYYNLNGDPHAAVTFPFDAPLPNDFWYGSNLCRDGSHGGAAVHLMINNNPTRGATNSDDHGHKDGGGCGAKKGDDGNDDRGDPTIKMKTKVAGSVKTVILRV